MRARILNAAAVMPLLLMTAVPALGQSVLLRLNPESGLVTRYVTGMETLMDSPMMSSDEPFMIGQIWTTQTVLSVEGDIVEYEMVTDSANLESPAMPMIQSQMPDMSGQVQTIKMDTRGHLVEMDLTDVPEEAHQVVNQMGGMGLQLPENEVSPGDSWDANIDYDMPGMPGGGEMAMSMQMTYTLTDVSSSGGSRMATISFEGPIVMSGGQGGVGMQASGTTSGTIVFDVTRGRMTANQMTMVIDMDAGGMAMSMTQSVDMRLVN